MLVLLSAAGTFAEPAAVEGWAARFRQARCERIDCEHWPLTERPELLLPSGCAMAKDASGFWVVLLPSSWTIGYLEEKNPTHSFGAEPPSPPRTA